MQFTNSVLALLASAAVSHAATLTFHSLDNIQRTIYFTGNAAVDPATIPGNSRTSVEVPDDFTGNFYAVQDGAENVPGMLGEVAFGGWDGITYFDVSAIVDSTDVNNIHEIHPHGASEPISGCPNWPCDNAYWHPDDVQTKTTDSTHLTVTLGTN